MQNGLMCAKPAVKQLGNAAVCIDRQVDSPLRRTISCKEG